MNAHDGAGFARLRTNEPALAAECFNRALELFPEHARTMVGLGAALAAAGDSAGADAAFARTATAIDALRRGGRSSEATLAEAMCHAVQGRIEPALDSLNALLDRPDVPFSGWTIRIEPLLEPVRKHADFTRVATRLAERAR
jgi:Flp pilus assembly protein TadD